MRSPVTRAGPPWLNAHLRFVQTLEAFGGYQSKNLDAIGMYADTLKIYSDKDIWDLQ